MLELDVEQEVQSRLAQAMSWRKALLGSTFYFPLPVLASLDYERKGRWLTGKDEYALSDLVGLDAQQRPVVLFQGPDLDARIPYLLWRYDVEGPCVVEEIDLRRRTVTTTTTIVDGIASMVTSGNPGGFSSTRLLRYEGEQLVRADIAACYCDSGPSAVVKEADWSPDGRLWQIRHDAEPLDPPLADAPLDERLAAALEQASAMRSNTIVWDGRISAPEPWPADTRGLASSLAGAYFDAILSAIPENADVEWIDIRIQAQPGSLALPPRVMAAGPSFVASVMACGIVGLDVIGHLWTQEPGADANEIKLVDELDEPALHAGRAISTALREPVLSADNQAAGDMLLELAGALADRLGHACKAGRLPLALVHPEGLTENPMATAFEAAERTIRTGPVDRFIATIGADPATD
jgi:hypothetical protein